MEHLSTSLDTIECPHCHNSFPITSALQHLIEPLRNKLEKEAAHKEQALEARAETLKAQEVKLAKATEDIEKKVATRVEETTKHLKQDLLKEAEATVRLEIEDMKTQLQEKNQKIVALQKTELALRRKEQALEERAEAMDLEVQRKLGAVPR